MSGESGLRKCILLVLLLPLIIMFFYGSRFVFPVDQYKTKLANSVDSGAITNNLIVRSPAGWGSDRGTECFALSIGLKPENLQENFLDLYPLPAKNSWQPCEGLIRFLHKDSYENQQYARYWHGYAILTQWLVLIFGFPQVHLLLWVINIILINTTFNKFRSELKNKFNKFYFIFAYILYLIGSGAAEIYSSIPHVMSSIYILLSFLIILKISKSKSKLEMAVVAFLIGGFYTFTFTLLNPQSIPVMILSWVPIILSLRKCALKETFLIQTFLLIGYSLGATFTWISKWVIVERVTNFDIWRDVTQQISLRTSQNLESLSSGVSQHLSLFENFPVPIKAIIANISAFTVNFADPRYSSLVWLILFSSSIFGIIISIFKLKLNHAHYFVIIYQLFGTIMLIFYYAILSQHSFDHATFTYRSIVFIVSGVVLVGAIAESNQGLNKSNITE